MIVWHTLVHRWYAFAFIPGFFAAAVPQRGWLRAIRFWVIASAVSLMAEYSSTHNGFPYGRYAYVAPRGKELFFSNVPIFVPLTFGIVVWAGRAAADARTKRGMIIGGALCATALDLVIDPVTLRGGEWFLGPLYRYAHNGYWFGVPWSNYAGWFLVAAAILALDGEAEFTNMRSKGLAGAICAFFIPVGFAIHHERLPLAGVAVTLVLLAVTLRRALPKRRGTLRSPA